MKLYRIIDLDRDIDEQHPPYYDLPAGVDVPTIGDEVTIQEWVPGLGECGPGIKKTVEGIVRLTEKPARYRLLFKPEARP
ncbi:MAG: hypothetical protein II738_03595 [Clostridia bacterium]|nr:hypothetical protein [Clostridia bacterium]